MRTHPSVLGFTSLLCLLLLSTCATPLAQEDGRGSQEASTPQPLAKTFLVTVGCLESSVAGDRSLMGDGGVTSVTILVTNGAGKNIGSGALQKRTSNWGGKLSVGENGRATFTAYAKDKDGGLLYSGEFTQSLVGDGTDNVSVLLEAVVGVVFLANGSDGGSVPAATPYEAGQTVTLPDNTGALTKTGYLFTGWSTAPDASGIDFAVGDTFDYTGRVTLHAVWLPVGVLTISGTTITKCAANYAGRLIVPPGITTLGDFAFQNCSALTQVRLGTSVTTVKSFAFSGCTGLTSIPIPASVAAIANASFSGCSALEGIQVADTNPNYTAVDGVLFTKDGKSLLLYPTGKKDTSYTVPQGVITIVAGSFGATNPLLTDDLRGQNTSLATLEISNTVTTIGAWAFVGCSSLATVTMPSSVTTLGNYAFQSCTSLTSLDLPTSLTAIPTGAFLTCTGLTSVTIPSSVTSIGVLAFGDCTSLTSLTIPASVTGFSFGALPGLTGLKDLVLLAPLTTITSANLSGFPNLENITIPKTVTTITPYGSYLTAFSACPKLQNIHVDPLNTTYQSIDGVVLNKAGTYLYAYPRGRVGAYTIPVGVTTILLPFVDCQGLTQLTLPASTIDTYASFAVGTSFTGCTGLESFAVDPANTEFGTIDGVLCSKDGTILYIYPAARKGPYTIPPTVTTLAAVSFWQCQYLTALTLPETLINVGHLNASTGPAFYQCNNLTELTVLSNNAASEIFGSSKDGWFNIETITLGGSVTSFGTSGVPNLRSLHLGATLSSSVTVSNAPFLTNVFVEATTPPESCDFSGASSQLTILVPPALVDTYRAAQYWSSYNVQPAFGVEIIGN